MATSILSRAKLLQSFAVKFCRAKHGCTKLSRPVWSVDQLALTRYRSVIPVYFKSINAIRASTFSTSAWFNSQTRAQNNFQVSKDALVSFAEKINWSLSSEELLVNALTHKSYVTSEQDKQLGSSFNHNERLIYLGYQTASSFLTEILYFKYPNLTAEQLWDLQNGLLREALLEKCGRKLGLQDLIFSKDEINGQIIAEALLAVVGSIYMDQTPGLAREFVENHLIPELTDDTIKEICQLEHPKFMLQQLNPGVNLMAKILAKHSSPNIYGDERENFKVGIYQQDELVSEGQGDLPLRAEKNAFQNLLLEKYLEDLKTAKFPLEYSDYVPEDEINFGLLPEGMRVIEVEKGEIGFGFSLKGGEMRSEENRDFVKYHYYFPPFVSSVVEGGPAERCGLKAGDVILTINDKSTKGMGHHKVVKFLESLKGKVKFTVKFSKKILISDDIENKFGQFKERKLMSQLTDSKWSEWHHAHSKNNRQEYENVLGKHFGEDILTR